MADPHTPEEEKNEQTPPKELEKGSGEPSTESDEPAESDQAPERRNGKRQTVLVVGPDGKPVGVAEVKSPESGEEDNETDSDEDGSGDENDPSRLVEQPAKVMRIGSMIKQLLEEVRAAPLDEAGRSRLREIHARSITELEDGLAPELRDELDRLSLPFTEESAPSEPELRIAQAQLVGWLEGLFHGIQAALVAQQMATRMQIEHMRRAQPHQLPMGGHGFPGGHGEKDDTEHHQPGQYL